MKNLTKLVLLTFSFSCAPTQKEENQSDHTFFEIIEEGYELIKPKNGTKAVLILFGGYPERAQDIKREFDIIEEAENNKIAVLFMNYNQKLWLEEEEKQLVADQLEEAIEKHELSTSAIFIGGFSSGGNVALLIGDFLIKSERQIQPKGVFIVDSPIDLAELYFSAEKNIDRNFSEVSVNESKWIIQKLGNQFGSPHYSLTNYEHWSVFTGKTNNTSNLESLKSVKIRLYTEPDSVWWKENRMADYNQTNAYHIKKLAESLERAGFENVDYIPTINRGYRANGQRHPHSWAIVDKTDLIDWVLKE